MLDKTKWSKNENFEKEDSNHIIREVAAQAENLQKEQTVMPGWHRNSETKYYNPEQGKRDKYTKKRNDTKNSSGPPSSLGIAVVSISGTNQRRDHFELPLCLNPECKKKGVIDFIRKCEI